MSAAEKLKALGARLDEFEPKASVDLCVALPQIVAVVEAAEVVAHGDNTVWGTSDGVGFVLQDALGALDEALS